jgi:hypothetical protein
MPSTTELAIKVFLRTSRGLMPNYRVTRGEIEGVAAFILSLKHKDYP